MLSLSMWVAIAGCVVVDDGSSWPFDARDQALVEALAGDWVCDNGSGYPEYLTVATDPSTFEAEYMRQVGADGDADVPYPTVCRYRYVADDVSFGGGGDFDHEARLSLAEVRLVEDPTDVIAETDNDGPACAAFAERELDYGFHTLQYDDPADDTLRTSEWSCTLQ